MTSSRQPEQLRLFVAVMLPAEAREAIARLIHALRAADVSGLRLVDPEGVHLTLKFLGNVDRSLACPYIDRRFGRRRRWRRAIRAAAEWRRRVPEPTIPSRPMGRRLRRHLHSVAALARRVDDACSTLGFSRERRPFSPHLTLARVRESASAPERQRSASIIKDIGLAPTQPFSVQAFHLVRSTLTPSGPIYETVHTVPMAASPI